MRSSWVVRDAGLVDRVRGFMDWLGESRLEAGEAVRGGPWVWEGAGEGGSAVWRAGVGGWKGGGTLCFVNDDVDRSGQV